MKKFLRSERAVEAARSVLHLPLVSRLAHKKARRTVVAITVGSCIMVVGSGIAAAKEEIGVLLAVHHLLVDSVGYFLHAAGAIPVLRHVEPLWLLLMGEE